MVVNQPLGAHSVGGQDVDDLVKLRWNGFQSDFVVVHQPQTRFPVPA
jgi:hypothetical protein